jgi:hypothetical protein
MRFVPDWYRSVEIQENQTFDLWIGLDAVTPEEVQAVIGTKRPVRWLAGASCNSPAQIRLRAMQAMVQEYEFIVFSDSDDVMYSARVEKTLSQLNDYDVVACAMDFMDERGESQGITFRPAGAMDPARLLIHHNVFGLSNSAYRADVLRQCLPFDRNCELIDWLLATRALNLGARMTFDYTPAMSYRQYSANAAPALPPFTQSHVLRLTEKVVLHYQLLLQNAASLRENLRLQLSDALNQARRFYSAMRQSEKRLSEYVKNLNSLQPEYIWWWCVANRSLEHIWNQ